MEVVLQFRSRHIGPRHNGGLDLLTVDGIRNPKGRRKPDGGVAEQDGVDLRGRDLLTAAIDQFLDATGHREITVAIENPQVARAKPSADECLLVGLGVTGIAVHDSRSAHHHLTLAPHLRQFAVVSQDGHLHVRPRADAPGFPQAGRQWIGGHLMGRLRQGVGLQNRRAETIFELFQRRRGQR